MSSLLPPSIRDERFLILEQLVNNLQAIDLQVMRVYDIDTVTAEALYDLADQFNVLGLRGWLLADTEAKRRALVKEAIVLHRKSGTVFAIKRSMTLVGYPNSSVIENPPLVYDGTWSYNGEERYEGKKTFGFIVVLDPVQSQVSTEKIDLIIGLINEWKNARSRLLDLRIGDISLFTNLLQYDGTWRYNANQEYDGVKNLLIHANNFNSATTVLLSAQTPDYAIPGFAYVNGTIGSCSGGILTITAASEIGVATPGVVNVDIEFRLAAVAPTFILLLRRNGALNQDVRIVFNVGGAVQIVNVLSGSPTVVATSASYTVPTTWINVQVALFESSVRVVIDNVEIVTTNAAQLLPNANLSIFGNGSQLDYLFIRERFSP